MRRITKFLRELGESTSGNAMMLVAMGAPVLLGATGFAVDTAQWYLWKRELQYAADQAALAGAWARGNGDVGTEYQTRATQEFSANIAVTTNYSTLDSSNLEDFAGGTDNSVVVTASTEGTLPFAKYILGGSTTVRVRAQATYETVDEWTACLLALDPDASEALLFHGGPFVDAGCGVGAISNADDAIAINGNSGTYNVGWAISGGGIDDQHGNFAEGSAEVVENLTDLFDPFADLEAPDNPTSRNLSCGNNATTWTADATTTVEVGYNYYRGNNANSAVAYDGYADAKGDTTETTTSTGQTYTSEPTGSDSTVTSNKYSIDGSGQNKIFEETVTRTVISYSNIVMTMPNNDEQQPGTYGGFNISCDTTLASGIYVIDGGQLNVNAQYSLTGSGVMFVLKNGAGIQINGGAEINLSPMNAAQLEALGMPAEQAEGLAGMLIFEDRDSAGNTGNSINGNASTNLNGVVYLPNSHMALSGSMSGTSECLMIASATLSIGGSASLSTFCPAGEVSEIVVGMGGTRVRLVG